VTFNSIQYALFLPTVVVAYWALPKRARLPLLLAASYVFYGSWDYRFLSLIVISTASDFVIGRTLGRTEEEGRRRLLMAASLIVNLSILGFFKYFHFFVDSAAGLLTRAGLSANATFLEIVLPVGISFYTFQTISYTFDVYRRRMDPCQSPVLFAVYVAYFPQLVAGPIERARRLLPQLSADRRPPAVTELAGALGLIFLGLLKKVVIADRVGVYVDQVYANHQDAGSMALSLGVLAFAIQVYGDFSGYTDIARGSSRLFSVHLMENFTQPHLSRNITEFWQRWHISLSSWLREYLYVPLGGNQKGRLLTYRNLIATMLLGGLWHGAAWTYVVWGGCHGVYLAIHRAFQGETRTGPQLPRARHGDVGTERPDLPRGPRELLAVAATFTLVALTLVIFRAESLAQAFSIFGGLLSGTGPGPAPGYVVEVLLLAALAFGLDVVARLRISWSDVAVARPQLAGAAAGLCLLLVVIASGAPSIPFIYFQF
jgi:D-alanyl-lipoteichoic acid acyltransferase DltB (MBOAT superfamily)